MKPDCVRCKRAFAILCDAVPIEKLGDSLNYRQWVRSSENQIVRVTNEVTVSDRLEQLKRMVPHLLYHSYIKRKHFSPSRF